MSKLVRRLKEHFAEVARTKTSPHKIALGFAIGTLLAILPTPGFGILIGLAIIALYPDVNKYALLIAMFIFNPITNVPFYLMRLKIGNMLFGSEPVIRYNVIILDTVYNFTRRFLVGNMLVASSVSFCSYFIVKKITQVYQMRHAI